MNTARWPQLSKSHRAPVWFTDLRKKPGFLSSRSQETWSSHRQQERCMSKFAIRLLTLAMFSMAVVAAPFATRAYAAPDTDAPPPPPPPATKAKAKKKTSENQPGI